MIHFPNILIRQNNLHDSFVVCTAFTNGKNIGVGFYSNSKETFKIKIIVSKMCFKIFLTICAFENHVYNCKMNLK